MKKHVGKWFIYYKFFNVLWLGLILIGSIYALLMLLNIDSIAGWSIYLIVGVLIGGLFLNTLIGMLVQKNYKDNTFYEITNRHIRAGQAMCYAYFKEEKTAPVHNVLNYRIVQNPLLKLANIYVLRINCGSEFLKIYAEKDDITKLEYILKEILKDNLKYRRYKDE